MNILGLDRNAGASKADQYVLKQSSKKLDGMLMNHVIIGILFTVPSSSSVPKRKKREIFLGTVALVGLNLFFILH